MRRLYFILVTLLIVSLLACVFVGSVDIPYASVFDILLGKPTDNQAWKIIVWQSRVPQALTALFAGTALATSGLLLQTVFNNPLAGPSILGITSGASLGVAIVTLLCGGVLTTASMSIGGWLAMIASAILGAIVIMLILLLLSSVIYSSSMLLIAGIMIGYITNSVISLLNFFATAEGVHSYTIWGLGNFSGVSMSQMPIFSISILLGLIMSIMLVKPLNAMLLGLVYAENLGVNIRQTRTLLLVATGVLTAVVTAFCGPISFIGLAVPHIARLVVQTSNHNSLLPITMLLGAIVAVVCNFVSMLPGQSGVLPLNAITPIFGAPIIIYVILNQRKLNYFN